MSEANTLVKERESAKDKAWVAFAFNDKADGNTDRWRGFNVGFDAGYLAGSASIQKQSNEAHAALAVAFGELVEISLLTPLRGEVDDYAAVTAAVRKMRNALEKLVSGHLVIPMEPCGVFFGNPCTCGAAGMNSIIDVALHGELKEAA